MRFVLQVIVWLAAARAATWISDQVRVR